MNFENLLSHNFYLLNKHVNVYSLNKHDKDKFYPHIIEFYFPFMIEYNLP